MSIPITGGAPAFHGQIRAALSRFPAWYVRAARVRKIIVSERQDVRNQLAMMEHGTRHLYVWPGIGDLLVKAIGHELAHGCDDFMGHPHYFTSVPEWTLIHRNQQHFDLAKYRDEPLEYFADMVVKLFLLGPARLSITNPAEVKFITSWVFPTLQKEFGNG